MAIAPVLKKARQPTDEQILETLKKIDSRVSDISGVRDNVSNFSRKQRSDTGSTHTQRSTEEVIKKERIKDVKENEKKIDSYNKFFAKRTEASRMKSDSFIGKKLESLKDSFANSQFAKGTKDVMGSALKGIAGPLNLIFEPFTETFGTEFLDFLNPFKKKVKPTDSDIRKAEPGFFWFWKKTSKEDAEKKKGGMLDGLLGGLGGGAAGGVLAKLGPMLMKGGAITAIVGSLIWMAIDGIAGAAKSGEWGVSKLSGIVGAVLGGTGSGVKGAFAGAGKWALMGAGIGTLIAPVVGTIIGGLLGAAVGSIMGFFGGKKIAQGFDRLKKWFMDTFDFKALLMASPIGSVIRFVENLKSIWKDDNKTVLQKVGSTFKAYGTFLIDFLTSPFRFLKGLFTGKFLTKEARGKFGGFVTGLLSGIGGFFKGLFSKAVAGVSMAGSWINDTLIEPVKNFFSNLFSNPIGTLANVGSMIIGFYSGIFSFIGAKINDFLNTNIIGQTIKKYLLDPITGFFRKIGDFFGYIGSMNILDMGKSILSGTFFTGLDEYERGANVKRTLESDEFKTWESSTARGGQYSRSSDQEKYDMYQRAQKVNDAIITPQGRVIIPSADDTIVATKSKVSQVGFDSEMGSDLSSLSRVMQESFSSNEIVDRLIELIGAVKDKPFNNIFTQSNNTNLDSLRFEV